MTSERDLAATLLALAGVRTGETVVAAGLDGLLARSAAAAAGESGVVHESAASLPDASVQRVVDGTPSPDLAAYARVLVPGGRLVLLGSALPDGFDVVRTGDAGANRYVVATRRT